MEQILDQAQPHDERARRILGQMARELLLMQGSDWPFLLFTTQAKEYANQRFHHTTSASRSSSGRPGTSTTVAGSPNLS
jgi:predicted glycosyl hydrolase (DUF1957 family)